MTRAAIDVPTDTPADMPAAVHRLHIDGSSGVTATMLLGALVDAGASVPRAVQAIETLGRGDVRLSWVRVERQELVAIGVRLRAPIHTPAVGSWQEVRELVRHCAVDDPVRDLALGAMTTLVETAGEVLETTSQDLHLPQVTMLDHVALSLALASAVVELGIRETTLRGPLAIGSGVWTPLLGPVQPLPDPIVIALTRELPIADGPRPNIPWTSRLGAAWLTALGAGPGRAGGTAAGRGFGAATQDDDHDGILRATLYRLDQDPSP